MTYPKHRPAAPTITIVIPALNEAKNLRRILPQLAWADEVILVDGHSEDGTLEAAREAMPEIKALRQTRRGKGNALACGFAAATGDIIVMFDADGSADPTEINRFVAALQNGADFAKGSRYVTGGGSSDITGLRSIGNRALTLIMNTMFRARFTDLCYGYNAFWRDVVVELDLPSPEPEAGGDRSMQWGDGFEIETVINCRVATSELVVHEVPSFELPRMFGVSNLNAISDGLRVGRTLITEWRRAFGRRAPSPAGPPRQRRARLHSVPAGDRAA
ncbi:glycosyltransferase involved in cell wall biosynthesis [Naumannella cuiyingiana]|uniref:Glycosyltransferase involved in cell wall biosynthesis n=1 Tax=Naumannella cuiyingiana TaxID=1347891 RepID=A0A7Z0DBB4_9ACTN|nr:glycosyltransferase involved in cell wall biosynthesis [Naumannella cuiyingiana]